MDPNVNLEQQYQQSQQPYPNQGMPMGNQPYGGYQYNMGMASTQKRTSDTLAVASLVLGIISIVGACCLGGFLGIIGAILGIIAITDSLCRKKAAAITGIILSALAFLVSIPILFAGVAPAIMPDVTGLKYYEAKDKIEDTVLLELNYEKIEEYNDSVEEGLVIRTNPEKDSELTANETVTIYVSKGKEIIMPDIIGMSRTQAEEELDNIGFTVYVTEEYSESEINTVIRAEYNAGDTLNDEPKNIDIVVSKGTREQEIQTLINNAQNVSYDDLIRYPDSYQTTPIKITATVTKLDDQTFLGVSYDTAIWATFEGETIILTDNREVKEPALRVGDTVTIYGYGNGTSTIDVTQKEYQGSLLIGFSYDAVVDSYDVPNVNIDYIEF